MLSGRIAVPIALAFLMGVGLVVQTILWGEPVDISGVLGVESGAGLGEVILGGAVTGGDGSLGTAMAVPSLLSATALAGVRGVSFGIWMVVALLVVLAMAGAVASLPTVVAELPATTVGEVGASSASRIAGGSAFGQGMIRGQGEGREKGNWVHFGGDEFKVSKRFFLFQKRARERPVGSGTPGAPWRFLSTCS